MSEAPKITMPDFIASAFDAWWEDNATPVRMHASYPPGYVENAEEEASRNAWLAAYLAGMEAAAQICAKEAAWFMEQAIGSHNGIYDWQADGASKCTAAIDAAIRAAEGAIKP